MTNSLTQSRLRKVLKKTSAPQTGWLDVFPAVIGTASGVVSTGIPGIIYVRNFLNGQVLSVYNFVTPNTAGLQVEVGRKVETPGLWQVKGVREAYSVPAGGSVNAGSHTHDDLFVPAHRFLRFLALPINGGEFMVQIYGDVFRNAAGEVTSIVNQQADLSSYVPATGAKWVVIHADSTGAISVNAGLEVDSKEILTLADIPAPVNGYVESCAVRLYAGQAQLYRDPNSINDFVDLRGLRANGVNLSLDDLTDVTASGANDGDVLTYDAFYDMWLPVAPTGGDVESVNGQTGTVVLDADDIDDTSTTNKFATAAELAQIVTNQTNISNHISDTDDAHDASAISVADSGGLLTATDVEAALQEIQSNIKGRRTVPFGIFLAAALGPFVVNDLPYGTTIARSMTLKNISISVRVTTTSDSSNYYTIRLVKESAGAATAIASWTTQTANTTDWKLVTTSLSDYSITVSNATILYIQVYSKTGSPGSLYLVGPELEVQYT